MSAGGPVAQAAAGTTRRGLLRFTSTTATGGLLLAVLDGCGTRAPKAPPAGESHAAPQELTGDLGILAAALDQEHEAIAAYTAGIPLLSGSALDAATQFLAQEAAHAGELAALIKKGGAKPAPPSPVGYSLGNPQGQADVLALLHRIEQQQIAGYLAALPKLAPGPIRSTIASILANEAQHVSIIRSAAGLRPVPGALLTAAE